MPINGCESTVSFDLGVTNKFSQVGEFANPESMNGEDRVYTVFISRWWDALGTQGGMGRCRRARFESPPPMSLVDMGHCTEHLIFCSPDSKPVNRNV